MRGPWANIASTLQPLEALSLPSETAARKKKATKQSHRGYLKKKCPFVPSAGAKNATLLQVCPRRARETGKHSCHEHQTHFSQTQQTTHQVPAALPTVNRVQGGSLSGEPAVSSCDFDVYTRGDLQLNGYNELALRLFRGPFRATTLSSTSAPIHSFEKFWSFYDATKNTILDVILA